LDLGWPNTQCGASRGSQRTRRHFIAEVKTTCREFNLLSGKIIGPDPSVSDLVQPLAHGLFGLAANPITNLELCLKMVFGKKRTSLVMTKLRPKKYELA
jgi:hypothetical protein